MALRRPVGWDDGHEQERIDTLLYEMSPILKAAFSFGKFIKLFESQFMAKVKQSTDVSLSSLATSIDERFLRALVPGKIIENLQELNLDDRTLKRKAKKPQEKVEIVKDPVKKCVKAKAKTMKLLNQRAKSARRARGADPPLAADEVPMPDGYISCLPEDHFKFEEAAEPYECYSDWDDSIPKKKFRKQGNDDFLIVRRRIGTG